MITSTITWRYVADAGVPDSMETVHIAVEHDPEPWLGYWDGDQWRSVDSDPLGETVYAYAPLCAVPPMRVAGVAA